MGLVRKGIKRGSDTGDHTLLYSLQEILEDTNPNVDILIKHIIHDLQNHPNILSIGKGAFVTKFKASIHDLSQKELSKFIKIVKPKQRIDKLLSKQTSESIDIHEQLSKYTAIIQFEKYLKDPHEIIIDQFVSPVLESISKIPNNQTFGKIYSNLSVVTLEGNLDDVIITPPIGGFCQKTEQLILLYKEKGYLYEPLMYRMGSYHRGILQEYTDMYSDQNEQIHTIISAINDKIEEYNSNQESTNEYMNYDELNTLLETIGLPCKQGVYDSYHKLTHVITKHKVLIPIRPSLIPDELSLISLLQISESSLPEYKKVLFTLSYIDEHSSYKHYTPNATISVTGEKFKNKIVLFINEIILESGHYIPIQKEIYNPKIHRLPVSTHISYKQVDACIATQQESNDIFHKYIVESEYIRIIRNLLFQKAYLFIKDNSELMKEIMNIKHHPIKLRPHQCKEIYDLLYEPFTKNILFENTDYDLEYPDEKDDKLIIRHTSQLQNKELFHKHFRLFIELLIVYSESDYERFIQLDVNLQKIKETLPDTELLILYSDVINESYLDYFIKYSRYVRNVSLYNEGLSRSKLIQLHKLKDKSKLQTSFVKQYPQIIKTLFGRQITFINYSLDSFSEIKILSDILSDIISDQEEMNPEKLQSLFKCELDHRIHQEDLEKLSELLGIGFCLVTQLQTKRLEHDIIITIHKHAFTSTLEEVDMVLLYQTETNLYHIQKKGSPVCKISELQSKLFQKHLLNRQ